MENEQVVNVGIGFATGRKGFQKVLNTYVYNWKDSGLTDSAHVRLHLFIAYDLLYSNTSASDYTRISKDLTDKVDGIHFVDAAYIQQEKENLIQQKIIRPDEAELFFSSGYAAMRNAVLHASVQQGMDYLLFLDDDEYPMAVTRDKRVALWSGQPVLLNHLKYIQDADITNGYHCGYISPIPSIAFNHILPEDDFRIFIEAISNDIINWDNLRRVMQQGGVTYANTRVLIDDQAQEVPEVNRCKFISGSNLCINLTDVRRVFPFYNPPGARGEDTFLSTCLSERKVLRIPSFAFHNGFGQYNYLLSGVLPTELKPILADSKAVIARFYNACVGWVRYKPLLLYITQREAYAERIAEMRSKLALTLPKMAAYFKHRDFFKIMAELDRYDRDVQLHYQQFMNTQQIWERIGAYLLAHRTPGRD